MLPLLLALFVLLPQAAAPPAVSANVWKGRNAEFEAFLRTAKVVKIEDLKIGVTRPKRAYLEPGGLAGSFAWKPLAPRMYSGYWESYKSEVAAYELDKLLDLNMVPVVVERRVDGTSGAAVLWLENVHGWDSVLKLNPPPTWGFNLARMKMFDDLIGNGDRNKGNLLSDDSWNLFLIDHSRAFSTDLKLPSRLEHIDRRLWDRMVALDQPTLRARLGPWIDSRQIGAMLARRDRMQQVIDDLVKRLGAGQVFF